MREERSSSKHYDSPEGRRTKHMKNYRLYEAQDNAMNHIILTDGEGNAKHIDHDVSEDEIAELAKLFAEQGGELESRVESDWMSEGKAFDGLFAKREIKG